MTIVLESPGGARATVTEHGAHVLSWTPAAGDERLFLSARSRYGDGSSIRGGIPLIFPQFAAFGPLPKHGFARARPWTTLDVSRDSATFELSADAATKAIWPHEFAARVVVRVDDASLAVTLTVENRDAAAFSFTAALHTYLRVHDVERATIHGLEGRAYRDSAAGGVERAASGEPLRIAGEVDRIYASVAAPVEVREPERITRVASEGFRDVVVWNPGAVLAGRMEDMESDGWKRMVCVESAAISAPIRLDVRGHWRGTQRLVAVR